MPQPWSHRSYSEQIWLNNSSWGEELLIIVHKLDPAYNVVVIIVIIIIIIIIIIFISRLPERHKTIELATMSVFDARKYCPTWKYHI